VIDLHTHILPGLDDGSRSLEEALAMARAAADDGITALAGTPHVRDDWPTRVADMEAAFVAVREAVAAAGIPVAVLSGGEIALDRLPLLGEDELRRFGLGGNPRYLLVEFAYYGWPLSLADTLAGLLARGVVPVLAHPERNAEVQRRPQLLAPAVAQGALCQVTAAALDGRVGRASRAAAQALIENRLAHLVASDAHAPEIRAVGMRAAARAVGDERLAHWLTTEVPRAIVEDTPLPARPEPAPRRLRGLFRRSAL
jgi:protein-tyrosine phosphatase